MRRLRVCLHSCIIGGAPLSVTFGKMIRASGILAALLVTRTVAPGFEPDYKATEIRIAHFDAALRAFQIDLGRYPTPSEGLVALLERPDTIPTNAWHGPYALGPAKDAWNGDFVYVIPGIHNPEAFDIYSRGKDGFTKSGGGDADDINNWDGSKQWERYYGRAARLHSMLPLAYTATALAVLAIAVWWRRHVPRTREAAS